MNNTILKCPVCNIEADIHEFDFKERIRANCQRCGNFVITRTALARLRKENSKLRVNTAILSYWIKQQQSSLDGREITSDLLELVLKEIKLPRHHEQADNLVRFIGNNLNTPDEILKIDAELIAADIGAPDESGVDISLGSSHHGAI